MTGKSVVTKAQSPIAEATSSNCSTVQKEFPCQTIGVCAPSQQSICHLEHRQAKGSASAEVFAGAFDTQASRDSSSIAGHTST